jgi:hypothetical protein
VLFVLDGGKALAAAVRGTFGSKALIQRCRRHYAERRIMWMNVAGVGIAAGRRRLAS